MKTNSIIGVLAMVSLSFAACEKAENLLPGVDNAQRLANPSIDHAAASMLPHTVFNVPGGETTTYIYDAGKLKSIKNRTVTKQFEYDLLDRLSLVTIINPRAPGEVQVITYEYGPTKNRLPLSAIVRTDGTEDHAQLQRRILFKFNDAGLKISETEFSDELAFEVKHTLDRKSTRLNSSHRT